MEIAFYVFFYMQKVKSCVDGKMVNGYRFRALAVSNHGPVHIRFRILVTVLLTWDN